MWGCVRGGAVEMFWGAVTMDEIDGLPGGMILLS